MDELVRWLGVQLDEDERIARAVRVPHDWHQGPGDDPEWTDAEMVCMWPPEFHTPYERDKHWRGLTVEGPELAAHIAVHDPARVLREIDADRALIDEYSRLLDADAAHQREAARLAEAGDDADVIQLAALRREADYLPAMLHVLERWAKRKAAVYADRPGYREEWRP
jgi:hypothetical protein